MLENLNIIYKFNENIDLLRLKIETFLKSDKIFKKAKLISELNLHDEYDIDLRKVI